MTDTATTSSRRTFVLVLLLFFLPLLVAFVLYYGSGWRPEGTTNKGELIHPAVPLPLAGLMTTAGQPADAQVLRQRWTLVYIDDGQCAAVCMQSLANMHLVRQLLGKDLPRTALALLANGPCCRADLIPAGSDLQLLTLQDAAGAALLKAFAQRSDRPPATAQRIYLVDPLGNLMMSYRPGTDARDIYQDLKKLLSLSHIG